MGEARPPRQTRLGAVSRAGEAPAGGRTVVRMNPCRKGEAGEAAGSFRIILEALGEVPEIDAVEDSRVPPQCIAVGEVLALIDDEDAWDNLSAPRNGTFVDWITEIKPGIIFKHQYRRGADYPPGTVSAGYPSPRLAIYRPDSPLDLLTRERPIDVTARMRTGGYRFPRDLPWMASRRELVRQAERLEAEGLAVRYGKISFDLYLEELYDTKLGFNYRGFGLLTYRILEYFRAGVVMLTQPLGPEWPLRDDVVLEDGVHCVFCESPEDFRRAALALLKDRAEMKRMRKNILGLWRERLSLRAIGEWHWNHLCKALQRREETVCR